MAFLCVSPLSFAEKKTKTIKARITYYSPEGCKWKDRVACPKTPRAIKGITVAAHPDFKFGTKVKIPALKKSLGSDTFIVQDRGPAVTRKKAARGKTYVFDVYVKSNATIRKLANTLPMYMDVTIIE
jgi:hypothetical protein